MRRDIFTVQKPVTTGVSKGGILPGIKKIAVLRPNAIGDFVFSLPCLRALEATYPDAHGCYIGKQWHADFLSKRAGQIHQDQAGIKV